MELAHKLKLYLVLESNMLKIPLIDFLEEVLSAGVGTIQLRNKNSSFEEKLNLSQIIRKITSDYNALFIINDNLELALKSNADGIHLGINDADIKIVKKQHRNLIIGYSCNNIADVEIANTYADYAGIGPYTNTSTKKDHRHILGHEGIYSLNKMLKIPAVAIGGINDSNAKNVLISQVTGLAVSAYLCSSKQPYKDALKLLDIINERV